MASGSFSIPRARVEALTDGIFAFAMTLLVVNLAIPDGFRPDNDADLLHAIADLDGALFAYAISFFVLGFRWMAQARDKEDPESARGIYLWAILLHLFTITTVPFSTMVIGRFDDYPAAVWVYSANMGFSALAALAVSVTAERLTGRRPSETGRFALLVLIATALLAIVLSFHSTRIAMFAYLGNILTPFLQKWAGRLL
jgi:uncharacterized membrane protein